MGMFCILYFYNVFMCLQILFELLAKGGTVKELIEKKDLVQVSCRINCYPNFYHVVCESEFSKGQLNSLILKHKVASMGLNANLTTLLDYLDFVMFEMLFTEFLIFFFKKLSWFEHLTWKLFFEVAHLPL